MRIAAVRATPINLPLEAPDLWAHRELPGFSPTIVEVEISDGISIRVDSDQADSLATARMLGPALDDLGIANWEDPLGTAQEMVLLRHHCDVPFSTHNIDLSQKSVHGVPDAIVTNPTQHGGVGLMLRFVDACEPRAVDCWCSGGDSGIASAAYLRTCAALAWTCRPSQSPLRMQPIDVIEHGPMDKHHDPGRLRIYHRLPLSS